MRSLLPAWKPRNGDAETPTELFVHAHDLVLDGGAAFVQQVHEALEDTPGTLLVNLIAGNQLRLASVTTLLRARWEARNRGWTFMIRPTNRAVRSHLAGIGLGAILAGSV